MYRNLPKKSTGSETDVLPPKLSKFDFCLECLILQPLLIRYFQKQHLGRGKGREGPHINESFGKNDILRLENYVNTPSVCHNFAHAKKTL